jgi:serralysin
MANIFGTSGNDTITPSFVSAGVTGGVPSTSADIIVGGDGDDVIDGGGGSDSSFGGNGNDYIFAVLGTPESIDGGAGVDTLDTTHFSGDYVVNLATGLTNFAGESFINMENLISGSGDDTLTGTAGANTINGGDGDDIINGGGGSDTSLGGNGNDYIFAVLGTPETINGGAGVDTLDTTAFTGDYVVNLATGLTNFAGESFTNMENLISGSGDDNLTGTGGANTINGGDGDDVINGGGGSDTSLGGNGNDYIFAVLGTPESIDGGAGIDSLDTTPFTGN